MLSSRKFLHPQAGAVSYFRNFIFGVEDSLVSTVGLLSGVAIAEVSRETVFLSGLVLIFVEAFSMAAGSFLSESSAEGYARRVETVSRRSLVAGGLMFLSYFVSGFIPLFPYIVLPVDSAFWVSILLSLAALFTLGIVGGKVSGISIFRNGVRMALIGGVAIGVGVIVGKFIA
jgi:VIT1/CCC1 family predicted Fe2+/Mn2+ transporter